jgi:hypothetical protein
MAVDVACLSSTESEERGLWHSDFYFISQVALTSLNSRMIVELTLWKLPRPESVFCAHYFNLLSIFTAQYFTPHFKQIGIEPHENRLPRHPFSPSHSTRQQKYHHYLHSSTNVQRNLHVDAYLEMKFSLRTLRDLPGTDMNPWAQENLCDHLNSTC